jgi:hypothetical protein
MRRRAADLAPLALSPLLLLSACAEAPPGPAPMTGDEIRGFLAGHAFACREAQASWVSSFAPDGGYSYLYEGQRVAGRWRLKDGPKLCTLDAGWPEEQCYTVSRTGRGLTAARDEGGVFTCDPA